MTVTMLALAITFQVAGAERTVPYGQWIWLTSIDGGGKLVTSGHELRIAEPFSSYATSVASRFKLSDRGQGRITLEAYDGRLVTVTGPIVSLEKPGLGDSQVFQSIEMPHGGLVLASPASHRSLRRLDDGSVLADAQGAEHDPIDGASFTWEEVR